MGLSNDLRLSVGITTRNRLDSLVRCVRSLALLTELVKEVIVVDDGSDMLVGEELHTLLDSTPPAPPSEGGAGGVAFPLEGAEANRQ